ncbi:MAG: GH92 family glycosyl hydrolase [Verrucomicrobiota bacterium]|nr:GH92 family glycosyl hydrolase [Verrucomicrobiota bacterium]
MWRLLLSVLLLAPAALLSAQTPDLVDKVNPIIGTTGPTGTANYGGVCPWVAPPHAMTDWTPMTQENAISRLPYRHEQRTLIGFMGTHQPTVWMGDYGFLTLMPETGAREVRPQERGLEIVPGTETARPYCYAVQLRNPKDPRQGNIGVEMTASARCALFQFTYPKAAAAHLFIEMSRLAGYRGWVKISADRREIVGDNPDRHNVYAGKHMGPELTRFKGWYVIQFEKPFDSFATWDEPTAAGSPQPGGARIHDGKAELAGARVGAFATFPARENENIRVCIGSSFISLEQARENLRREIPDWNFDRVAGRNKEEWNRLLNRIQITGGTPDEQTIFYTAMYHALLFPRRFDEQGRYYSPFDEKIHRGVFYDDYSMWDTFRALHPLLTLIDPEEVCPMIRALLHMFDQGGWIPKWPNPTYSNIMIGTPADAIIADAFVKGFRDYDLHKAYAAIYKDAMTPPEGDTHRRWRDRAEWRAYEARGGLTYYKALGYIPADKTSESVSRTLEDAFEDYCVAQVAKGLNKTDDYHFFMKRSENYRNVFNPATGFMQARLSDGSFYPGDPRKYSAFTEGSPWTYLFCVMQDVPGLIRLMGRDAFISKLDENFSGGHYAYDNEPENHYPYLYDYVDQPWKTQKILTDAVREHYRNTPDGITGNDDCGQMSAWYLFTALGFYPVTPASNVYALGRPFFPKAVLHLNFPKKNTFTILARNFGPGNDYVKSVTLDGHPLSKPFLKQSDLFNARVLEFEMSAAPNEK